jgi:hypothetical protein
MGLVAALGFLAAFLTAFLAVIVDVFVFVFARRLRAVFFFDRPEAVPFDFLRVFLDIRLPFVVFSVLLIVLVADIRGVP